MAYFLTVSVSITLGLNNLKTSLAMNAKISVFVIYVEAIIYLLLLICITIPLIRDKHLEAAHQWYFIQKVAPNFSENSLGNKFVGVLSCRP